MTVQHAPAAPSPGTPEGWTSGGEDDAVTTALAHRAPAVRVVHGRPDEVELAALVAGIVAASARSADLGGLVDEAAEPVRTRWGARPPGAGLSPGPGAWRWSLHPRG